MDKEYQAKRCSGGEARHMSRRGRLYAPAAAFHRARVLGADPNNQLHSFAKNNDAFNPTKRIRGDRVASPTDFPPEAHFSDRGASAK